MKPSLFAVRGEILSHGRTLTCKYSNIEGIQVHAAAMPTKSLAIFGLDGAGKKTLVGSLIYKVIPSPDESLGTIYL